MLATLAIGCILLLKEAAPFLSATVAPAERPAPAGAGPRPGPGGVAAAAAALPGGAGLAVQQDAAAAGPGLAAGAASPFIALGIVSNCMWQDSFERRRWLRETMLTHPNVGSAVAVRFVVALLQSDLSAIPAEMRSRLEAEAAAHGDMLLLPSVPERKSPCLKTMAWYRCVGWGGYRWGGGEASRDPTVLTNKWEARRGRVV